MTTFDDEKAVKKIDELKREEEEELALVLSKRHNVAYIDLSRRSIDTDGLRLIPEAEAKVAKVAIFELIGRKISLAVLSPNTDEVKKIVEDLERKNYTVIMFMVSRASLERAWTRYKEISFASETKAGVLDISNEEIQKIISDVKSLEDVKILIEDILKQKKSYKISRILEIILAGALSMEASDIHVEPEESFVRLRYRLDGVLTDIIYIDHETYNLLLSRIKLLSRLKLNVKSEAQDGRFSIKIGEDEIEIRTSILPGAYSESVVLRILNPKSIQVPMESLGMPDKIYKILEHEIKKPNGMLLTTGPTGSGKTTTLYAFLRKVHSPEIKIITIEDLIEYHLSGIVQTQVDHKDYTFAQGLRASLRQDPDVIMVGEIRDEETAETAINAALTGHFVLSTLHTNSAAGAFPRLLDLGINPKVISSAVNVAMAQRLIRRLCPICKKEVPIDTSKKEIILKKLSDLPEEIEVPQAEKMWEAVGCDKCSGLGYKGRLGIFEIIMMSEKLNEVINQNPSEVEIENASREQGLPNMIQDGLIKVLNGTTTLEELSRVIDIGL
jgi:type II secretory ATPase GspE/PulE/Tfp pilus assembly ATPase PilB-like protein